MELGDDFIEPVAHGGVTDLQQRGHFLQAAAGFHEIADEGLILCREGGEHGKRVNPLHLRPALVASEPLDLESMLTARADDGEALHLNYIDSSFNFIQVYFNKSTFPLKLWRYAVATLVQTFTAIEGLPRALTFCPSGRLLASDGRDCFVRVFELESAIPGAAINAVENASRCVR